MSRSQHSELVDEFTQFYDRYYATEIAELAEKYPGKKQSLVISYDDVTDYSTDLADDFLNKPVQITEYAEEALRRYDTPDTPLGQAHVRLKGLPDTVPLEDIRTKHIGTLIQVRGTVSSTSKVRSEYTDVAYECQRCGTLTRIPQPTIRDGSDREKPHECQGCERQGPFRVNSEQSVMVDVQTVVLEEQIRGIGGSDDTTTIKLRLEDDIAGATNPGDTLLVTGVLKYADKDLETTIPDKYIDVTSTVHAEPNGHVEITERDETQLREIASQETLFKDIVGSIAPSLYGHTREKLAVAFQLAGGVPKVLPDGSRIRGDIHLMCIGDPGTGKSILARAAARLAPRAVTVSGTDTSKVGLTASATPSSGDSDPWEVKGGALVRANNGLAVIDNMGGFGSDELAGLHSTIEHQEVNVSKASVTATLPAQSAVFTALNPKYGQFDQYEPIGEQINLPPDVTSQFDLVFTLTDHPDRDQDEAVADHILDTSEAAEAAQEDDIPDSPADPVIDQELLRKYFVYANRQSTPELTDEAKAKIRAFYVELRSESADEDAPVPVTARKIEAVVRLAEASARLRLADTITTADAERAIHLVQSCLRDLGVNPETPEFGADEVDTRSLPSKIQRDRLKDARKSLCDLGFEYEKGIPKEVAVNKIAEQLGVSKEKAEIVITELKSKGEAYEPEKGRLRTT
ncbi:minichromosome maintenance protein MCM [Salinibaculum rarum]|uniref:minichromosome maintenance protein MCM n=1 Tax=Salinibaculum rarum TaxID=3058903 RepID=UPI00265FDB73|nr:minichromosome maintenance protein MCM [Salinibaculum sp. KK48]